MSPSKRKTSGEDSQRVKKKYRSDGTPVWAKRHVEGPGVWVSCVKGREKQAVGEILDIFETIADTVWPKNDDPQGATEESDDENPDLSIEEQIAKQVFALTQPRGRKPQQRFANCQTNTPCVLFISCKPPIDPVELVLGCVRNIKETGVTRMRNIHRVVPVSSSGVANLPEIEAMCKRVLSEFFDKHAQEKFTYKIELRVRNHTTIPRPTMIQTIASCVPDGHTVDLIDPKVFILVEVFKSICGVSVVEDYYLWHKFNVMEIAYETKKSEASSSSRIVDKSSNQPAEVPTASAA